jgi:hypothetical protein
MRNRRPEKEGRQFAADGTSKDSNQGQETPESSLCHLQSSDFWYHPLWAITLSGGSAGGAQ